MGVNNWPCCLSLRGFAEQGTFNFKTGKVRRKTGWAGHPMCNDLTKSHHQGVSDMAIKAVVRHYSSEYLWWWGCWAVIFLKAPSNHFGKGAGSKWLSWGQMAVLVNWSLRRQKGREGMEREVGEGRCPFSVITTCPPPQVLLELSVSWSWGHIPLSVHSSSVGLCWS